MWHKHQWLNRGRASAGSLRLRHTGYQQINDPSRNENAPVQHQGTLLVAYCRRCGWDGDFITHCPPSCKFGRQAKARQRSNAYKLVWVTTVNYKNGWPHQAIITHADLQPLKDRMAQIIITRAQLVSKHYHGAYWGCL
jgi:hypothetical protein